MFRFSLLSVYDFYTYVKTEEKETESVDPRNFLCVCVCLLKIFEGRRGRHIAGHAWRDLQFLFVSENDPIYPTFGVSAAHISWIEEDYRTRDTSIFI